VVVSVPVKSVPGNQLLLTDDEVIAVAVARETYWPAGTPTVDVRDDSQLAAAVFRGNRSLTARGIGPASAESNDGDPLAAISGLPGGDRLVTVHLADESFNRSSLGPATAHYPGPQTWILESISPAGIHAFAELDRQDHIDYLTSVVQGVERSGPDREAPDVPPWLCVLAVSPERNLLVAARRGSVRLGAVTFAADGALVPSELVEVTADAAVSAVVEILGQPS
jgi:hypothetical protein